MPKLRDMKEGDKFKFGPRGMVWTVTQRIAQRNPAIVIESEKGRFRIYSELGPKRWNREVLTQ